MIGSAKSGSCEICKRGKYKDDTSVNPCTNCTVNSDSIEGSEGTDGCICNTGFTRTVNYYGTLSCTIKSCPLGQTLSGDAVSGSCVNCVRGKYKDTTSTYSCTRCYWEGNADSPEGSTSIDNCTCNAGYDGEFGDNTGKPLWLEVSSGESCEANNLISLTETECSEITYGEMYLSASCPKPRAYGCTKSHWGSREITTSWNRCSSTYNCGYTIPANDGESIQYNCACKNTDLFDNVCTKSPTTTTTPLPTTTTTPAPTTTPAYPCPPNSALSPGGTGYADCTCASGYVDLRADPSIPLGSDLIHACGGNFDEQCDMASNRDQNQANKLVDGQSSTYYGGIDWQQNWVRIDLGRDIYVGEIYLENRQSDSGTSHQLKGARLSIGTDSEGAYGTNEGRKNDDVYVIRDNTDIFYTVASNTFISAFITVNRLGRYIYIFKTPEDDGQNYLLATEFRVYGVNGRSATETDPICQSTSTRRRNLLQIEPISSLTAPNTSRLITEIYLPDSAELISLGLDKAELEQSNTGVSPFRGSNLHDWERLHVTVQMTAIAEKYNGCQYRIRQGKTLQFEGHAAAHLGCTLNISNKVGLCTMEIPLLLADSNRHLFVGAEVASSSSETDLAACQWPDAHKDNLVVVLAPHTILYECEEDFYWSETLQECEPCTVVASQDVCNPGQYIAGCDVLVKTTDNTYCEACPLPSGASLSEIGSKYEWEAGEICSLRCRTSAYWQDSDGTCQICTTSGTCEIGQQFQTCTENEDGKCVSCPDIQKGIYSENEEYYIAGDCMSTQCKSDYYQDTESNVCRNCTSLPILKVQLEALRQANTFYQFHDCTTSADSYYEVCDLSTVGVGVGSPLDPPHFYYTDDASEFDSICQYQCELGYEEQFISEIFQGCLACTTPSYDRFGEGVPEFYYYYETATETQCQWSCNETSNYYKFDDTCIECYASGAGCTIGQYPMLSQAAPVCTCSSCQFTSSNQNNRIFSTSGLVNDPHSCQESCDTNFYDDFGTCRSKTPDAEMRNICQEYEFRIPASSITDASCQTCGTCEGKQVLTPCSFENNIVCEECPPHSSQGVMFTGTTCTAVCAAGLTKIYSPDSEDWGCQPCAITEDACADGTFFNATRPISCTDCQECPSIPSGAVFISNCAWRCPLGLFLGQQDGNPICVQSTSNREQVNGPSAVSKVVCDQGKKLTKEGLVYLCTDCTEITPLTTTPPTWQWKLSPCDEPNQQGWECLAGFFQYQEFPELSYWNRPPPECLEEAERSRRIAGEVDRTATSSTSGFTKLSSVQHEFSWTEAAAIVVVALSLVMAVIYLACRGKADEGEEEEP